MFNSANKYEIAIEKAIIELIWKKFQASSKEDTGLDKNSEEFKDFFSFAIEKLKEDGVIDKIIRQYKEETSALKSFDNFGFK